MSKDSILTILVVLGLGGVAFWFLTRGPNTAITPGTGSNAVPGVDSQIALGLENGVSAKTGIPLAAIGNASIKAPTWLKVLFPVTLLPTAGVQTVINHPVATAKKVGSGIETGAKDTAHAVTGAVSSIGHVFGSIF
jgi:hypothetical protein